MYRFLIYLRSEIREERVNGRDKGAILYLICYYSRKMFRVDTMKMIS
jgi:hypothetical protein